MTKPLISVVVPLYRVEAEMPLCVDSVLAQTYDRLDVIPFDKMEEFFTENLK